MVHQQHEYSAEIEQLQSTLAAQQAKSPTPSTPLQQPQSVVTLAARLRLPRHTRG
eukprot:TRINITY_DN16961_c0_g1_i1.p1 TRINITY_DN16961_c0_g1~~TRINITY_DN16961_c0_g1_i1.p1  ORF type:complete len:55 (+),score=7.98 TRINITY_DN16961_c0_g1_i1:296-460(+)